MSISAAANIPAMARRNWTETSLGWLVVLVPFTVYLAFFIAPVMVIALQSLTPYAVGQHGGLSDDARLTLENYASVFSVTFRSVFADSLSNALMGTVLCLLIGYPVAYFISARVPERSCLARSSS